MALDDSGCVSLPRRVIAALDGSDLVIASSSPQHVLLAVEGQRQPCLSASLGAVGIADVLSFFNMFRQTGILYLDLPDGERQVFFQDGEIIFATSQRYEEDIGEVLCEIGKLERKALNDVRSSLEPDAILSQVLVRKNLVAARDLWLATRSQVEKIVYNLFVCQEGSCYFASGDLQRDDIVRLSMSTQNLIMEGLRRIDEKALYMRRLRSLDAVLSYSGRSPADLVEEEKKVVSLIYSTPATVGQLLVRSGLSEFDGLRVLYQLAEKRMVDIAGAKEEPLDGPISELFEIFNAVLRLLYDCVGDKAPGFVADANQFMREVPHPLNYVFRGVCLQPDGTLNGRQVVKNLLGLEEIDQMKLLVEGLNELVYMECMGARLALGAQGSADLIRRVQEITARAKRLLG
ncbi:MAG: DUF4388 domain-containing protein [Desulfuromonas sp.]|nr:DUF4388 domain-containing protein [Desulfuromonas sp.]